MSEAEENGLKSKPQRKPKKQKNSESESTDDSSTKKEHGCYKESTFAANLR